MTGVENHSRLDSILTMVYHQDMIEATTKETTTMTENKLTPETAEAGIGVTMNMYSDRHAGTIIEVRRNGKQIVIQRDKAERTNRDDDTFSPGGFVGHTESPRGQQWAYERNTDGAVMTANWSAKYSRFFIGGAQSVSVTMGRHEHFDYNF